MKINSFNFNEKWAQTVAEEVFVEHFLLSIWQDVPETERRKKLSVAYRKLAGKPDVAEQTEAEGQQEAPVQPEQTKRAKAKTKPVETNEGAE